MLALAATLACLAACPVERSAHRLAQEVTAPLADLRRRYGGAKDGSARIDFLKEAAALSSAAPAAPPPEVAEFIARALEDDDLGVRIEALRLLLDGQDPEAVVRALLAGWKNARAAWKDVEGQLEELCKKRGTYSKDSLLGRREAAFLTLAPSYLTASVLALGLVPDEHTEKIVLELLHEEPDELPSCLFEAACRAAQSLGSVRALEAEVACILRLEAAVRGGKLEPRFPRGEYYTLLDAWTMPFGEVSSDGLGRILGDLGRHAAERGWTAPPGRAGSRAEWKSWIDVVGTALPAKLDRPVAPVRATLPGTEPAAPPKGG